MLSPLTMLRQLLKLKNHKSNDNTPQLSFLWLQLRCFYLDFYSLTLVLCSWLVLHKACLAFFRLCSLTTLKMFSEKSDVVHCACGYVAKAKLIYRASNDLCDQRPDSSR